MTIVARQPRKPKSKYHWGNTPHGGPVWKKKVAKFQKDLRSGKTRPLNFEDAGRYTAKKKAVAAPGKKVRRPVLKRIVKRGSGLLRGRR